MEKNRVINDLEIEPIFFAPLDVDDIPVVMLPDVSEPDNLVVDEFDLDGE